MLNVILTKYSEGKITITVSNTDLYFTEYVMREKIDFKNLSFQIEFGVLDNIQTVLRTKYIPNYIKNADLKIYEKGFTFNDFEFEISDIDKKFIYKVSAKLVEKIPKIKLENTIKQSNELILNSIYGVINEEKLKLLFSKEKNKKQVFSNAEKDVMKNINNELEFQELGSFLKEDEVKRLTFENRNFKEIGKFLNSNYKCSKKMDLKRKNKILYSTNATLFYDNKVMKNNIPFTENPFLKNEWHMGPIYAYNYNYKNFI
jgi:hypothetical protein